MAGTPWKSLVLPPFAVKQSEGVEVERDLVHPAHAAAWTTAVSTCACTGPSIQLG
jgi:hypothetical protein